MGFGCSFLSSSTSEIHLTDFTIPPSNQIGLMGEIADCRVWRWTDKWNCSVNNGGFAHKDLLIYKKSTFMYY